MGNKCETLWNKLSTKKKKVCAKKRDNEKGNVNVSQSSGTLDQNIWSSVPPSKSKVKLGNRMSDMQNAAINESVRLKKTVNEKGDVDVSENPENVDQNVGSSMPENVDQNVGSSIPENVDQNVESSMPENVDQNVGSSMSSSKEEVKFENKMSDTKGKGFDVKEQVHLEKAVEDAEPSECGDEEKDEEHSVSSPEEEVGTPPWTNRRGMLPETLIYQDHERSFFDSAEWALSKQGKYVHKSLAVLESLEPKLKPTPWQQTLQLQSSFAPAGTEDESGASTKDASSSK